MIKKQTWLAPCDNTNVRWIKTFHLYKGFFRKTSKFGNFIKSSAQIVEPPRIEYKGFKFKYIKKGAICRSLIIRQKYNISKLDGAVIKFYNNTGLIIKKKQELRSKYIFGPCPSNLKRKKFIAVFKHIV